MTLKTIKGRKYQNSSEKAALKTGLKSGVFILRVVGNEATGFRLAAQVDADHIIAFGFVATKQTDAVAIGIRKYGQKAVKFAPNCARRPKAA